MGGRFTLNVTWMKVQRMDVMLHSDGHDTRFLCVLGRYGNRSYNQHRNGGVECPSSDDALLMFLSDGTRRLRNQGQSYGQNETFEMQRHTQANNQGDDGQVNGNGVHRTKCNPVGR
jgi:hypothetical protein